MSFDFICKSICGKGIVIFCSLNFLKIISKKLAPDSMQFIMYIDPLFYYHKSEENLATLSAINDSIYLYMEKVEIEIPSKLY